MKNMPTEMFSLFVIHLFLSKNWFDLCVFKNGEREGQIDEKILSEGGYTQQCITEEKQAG